MFHVSSVERDMVGFQPEAVAGLKREKLRKAVEALAASGDSRYAMSVAQITRFVNHWGARLRQTDRIRAEEDEYFSLPGKVESWVIGDRAMRGTNPAPQAPQAPVEPIDTRPISERLRNSI